jgi:hypothetical protein
MTTMLASTILQSYNLSTEFHVNQQFVKAMAETYARARAHTYSHRDSLDSSHKTTSLFANNLLTKTADTQSIATTEM